MNILFLDDSRERTLAFFSKYKQSGVTIDAVTNAKDCISLLEKNQYDHVFLDHDLGGDSYVDSDDPNTGMEVVRWIEQAKPTIGQIVVHSHNVDAAIWMMSILETCGYKVLKIPFASLIQK